MVEGAAGSSERGPGRLVAPWLQQGNELGRLLALSDGIFAFSMTLLVLGLALPAGFQPSNLGKVLLDLRGSLLTYVLSFFVIWLYWLGHQQVFNYVVRYDRRLSQLNVTFLLFIAVIPFTTQVLAAAPGEFLAVVFYATGQVAAGGTLTALWAYASRERRHVHEELPPDWISYVTLRTALTPLTFAVSIPIAFVSPFAAEVSWVAVFVVQAVIRRRVRRGKLPQHPS